MQKQYAPRDTAKGRKTKGVNIALDPMTKMIFEVAARQRGLSLAAWVADAAENQVKQDNAKYNIRAIEGVGLVQVEPTNTIEQVAALLLADTEARTFIRMAWLAPGLLREREQVLFRRIFNTPELWLRDPNKHLPVMPDGTEPKQPVVNYPALEEKWQELLRFERADVEDAGHLLSNLKRSK